MEVLRLYPDLPVRDVIGNEHIAFVPTSSQRISGMPHTVGYRKLARRFRDVRGLRPPVGFLAANTQTVRFDKGAEIAFRNIVAVSTITRANLLSGISVFGLLPVHWSDYFRPFVYAFTDVENEDQVGGQTPSQLGIDDASTFRPVTNPDLAPLSEFGVRNVDQVLYQALESEWIACFTKGAPDEKTDAQDRLFRSLEMAFIAAGMPYDSEGTVHDYGTRLALWVSAMEILVNANGSEKKKLKGLLGTIKTGRPAHDRVFGMVDAKGTTVQGNLFQHLLMRVYDTRNDFLHGNKVSAESLCYWADGVGAHRLSFAASLIYRLVLLTVLEVDPFTSQETNIYGEDLDRTKWSKWFEAVKRPEQPGAVKP